MPSDEPWRVIGATVRGAQHQRDCQPNQDAIAWWPQTGVSALLAVAVADGLGHAEGLRSDRGARFAVEIATGLAADHGTRLVEPSGREAFLRGVSGRLWAAWMLRVREDLAEDPIGQLDPAIATSLHGLAAGSALEARPEIAYGSTVIAAVAMPGHLVVVQLGDGDVLVVHSDGRVTHPVGRDADLIGNQTWSLASSDAPRRFRTLQLDLEATAQLVMVSTDGYKNSYRVESDFDQVGVELLEMLQAHGHDALAARLPGWLASTSEEGSGDDITVALLARTASRGSPGVAP